MNPLDKTIEWPITDETVYPVKNIYGPAELFTIATQDPTDPMGLLVIPRGTNLNRLSSATVTVTTRTQPEGGKLHTFRINFS